MKFVICLFLAIAVAMTYAQTDLTGGSGSGTSGASPFGRGGNINQVLLMAALNGNDNARVMLMCQFMNLPSILCMQQMA